MMKLIRAIVRGIRDGFKSVFRNFFLSIGSITSITITLLIVSATMMMSLNVNNFTKVIEKDITMVIFVDAETTEQRNEEILNEIKTIENVELVTFKSKEAAKKEFEEDSEIFKEIMGEWEEKDNPLKDSFLVNVKDITKIEDTANQIKQINEVVTTNYGEGMVQKLISAFEVVEKISFGVLISLTVVTVLLIINTIKLTIFSRKEEIQIMRLVGASNITIKQPFVIEGMILGILGSIIPIAATIYAYYALYDTLNGQVFSSLFKIIKPSPFVFEISLLLLALGIIVGVVGSARAVRKYLKI